MAVNMAVNMDVNNTFERKHASFSMLIANEGRDCRSPAAVLLLDPKILSLTK